MEDDGCRRTAWPGAAARIAAAGSKLVETTQRRKNAATDKQGKIAAVVRREPETADNDGGRSADETRGKKPAFAAGSWEDATDSGCDRIRLHPAGRADTREGAGARLDGRMVTALQQRYTLGHDRLLRRSQYGITLPHPSA